MNRLQSAEEINSRVFELNRELTTNRQKCEIAYGLAILEQGILARIMAIRRWNGPIPDLQSIAQIGDPLLLRAFWSVSDEFKLNLDHYSMLRILKSTYITGYPPSGVYPWTARDLFVISCQECQDEFPLKYQISLKKHLFAVLDIVAMKDEKNHIVVP